MVVTKAVAASCRCSTAFVATVVPCTTWETSFASAPVSRRRRSNGCDESLAGIVRRGEDLRCRGRAGLLVEIRPSVKVPPTSTPMRQGWAESIVHVIRPERSLSRSRRAFDVAERRRPRCGIERPRRRRRQPPPKSSPPSGPARPVRGRARAARHTAAAAGLVADDAARRHGEKSSSRPSARLPGGVDVGVAGGAAVFSAEQPARRKFAAVGKHREDDLMVREGVFPQDAEPAAPLAGSVGILDQTVASVRTG